MANKKNKKASMANMASKTKQNKQGELDMEDVLETPSAVDSYDDDNVVDDLVEIDDDQTLSDKDQKDIETALELMGEGEIIIDRDQEDKDVTEFQKTGDLKLLERVYKNRIPTLKSWANKNFYPGLTSSVEDLFEDLSVVFVKAAQKYNKDRGAFNTCLFTFLINRLKNIKNSKYARKRTSEEYDGPLNSMVLSLDFSYGDGDGSDLTLKDIIKSEVDVENSLDFRDTLSFLAKGNPVLTEFFMKIGDGNSLASLIKEYKMRDGQIDLSKHKKELARIKARKNKKLVSELIRSKNIQSGEFTLVNYELCGKNKDQLKYVVEMKKTQETDFIIKSIRDLKKHKSYYMTQLNGK